MEDEAEGDVGELVSSAKLKAGKVKNPQRIRLRLKFRFVFICHVIERSFV